MNDLRILLLEVTSRCNARCDQCGSRCGGEIVDGVGASGISGKDPCLGSSAADPLSIDDYRQLFSDVKEHLGTDMMLNITGGEPLMRRDLFEIMGEAAVMGFDWGMVSNGVLISDEIIEKMRKSQMKTITISLDGLKETHESLRHLPGSYDKILENVGKLKAADFLDHLQVTFTANARNAEELPALYETLAALKIDSLRVGMIDPIGRAKEYQELLLSSEQMEELFSFTNEKNQDGNLPIVWGCCHFLNDKLRNRVFTCPTGKTIASVLSNGDIFVCPNVPRRPELIQGNIRKDHFSEVWEKGFTYFRQEQRPVFCEGCKYLSRCKGDSLHTWDFKENRPRFCYSEVFEKQTTKYRGYLRQKYPNGSLLYVAAPEEADDIYVEPEAYQAIRAYFHMGRRHPASLFEQQMGLVGFQIDDNYVIKYVFPSTIDRLGPATAKFQRETLRQAEAEAKIIEDNFNNSDDREDFIGEGLRLLGFVHSHPAQEVLRYSGGDERLHRMLYRRWGVYLGLLVQPERDEIGVYYGGKVRQGNLKIIEVG